MKCNKCYQIIPLNEEIKEDKYKCYCETCYKSDKWKRTVSSIGLNVFAILALILLIGILIYVLKETFQKKAKDDD